MIDYEQDTGAAAASETSLEAISSMAANLIRYNVRISEAERELKIIKAEAREIETQHLPDVMLAAGMKEFVLDTGQKVTIKDVLTGSIPSQTQIDKARGDLHDELAARKKAGLAWLHNNGSDSIIKNEFAINIGKGHEEVVAVLKGIAEKVGLPYVHGETVHPQTLMALLREKAERGVELPVEIFAIFAGRKAIVK